MGKYTSTVYGYQYNLSVIYHLAGYVVMTSVAYKTAESVTAAFIHAVVYVVGQIM